MTLQEVLAGATSATAKAAEGTRPMESHRYPVDLIWAVAVRAKTIIKDSEIYPGRDPNGFQVAFISNRQPGANAPAGAPPAEQVTVFRQGAVVFNGVQVIDASTLTPGEIAAGQLLAASAGMLELSEAQVKELEKTIKAEDGS